MNKDKSTINYLNMEPADNGVVITYSEKTIPPATKDNTYPCSDYRDRKEVFEFEPDEKGEPNEEAGITKAFDRFKELWMRRYTEMKS